MLFSGCSLIRVLNCVQQRQIAEMVCRQSSRRVKGVLKKEQLLFFSKSKNRSKLNTHTLTVTDIFL